MWTRFMDMHSGGRLKEKNAEYIFIEAPENEAKVIFYNRFGHNPERVSCTCCGDDYSISEEADLAQATAFERGCAYDKDAKAYVERSESPKRSWRPYKSVDEYLKDAKTLIIKADEIKSEERKGSVPEQGYVWAG